MGTKYNGRNSRVGKRTGKEVKRKKNARQEGAERRRREREEAEKYRKEKRRESARRIKEARRERRRGKDSLSRQNSLLQLARLSDGAQRLSGASSARFIERLVDSCRTEESSLSQRLLEQYIRASMPTESAGFWGTFRVRIRYGRLSLPWSGLIEKIPSLRWGVLSGEDGTRLVALGSADLLELQRSRLLAAGLCTVEGEVSWLLPRAVLIALRGRRELFFVGCGDYVLLSERGESTLATSDGGSD